MDIAFERVSKVYPPGSVALEDVSFVIDQGEFVSFAGKSGAGKTTMLKLLLSEEKPSSGRVLVDGGNIGELSSSRLPDFRRKIGMVFQNYRLLPHKTAYENIAYVMEVMGAAEQEITRDVTEVLRIVGLSDRSAHFPDQLSGGEKQRVAIARALIHRPGVILADEPTGNLDPYHTRDIINLLLKINELGTTIVLATHNKEVINRLGKRVLSLYQGRLVRDEKKGRFVI
ncbi:MAG TPA: cell division ATP-binding protein FtsE [Candidatus Paceibacterota bacterium]